MKIKPVAQFLKIIEGITGIIFVGMFISVTMQIVFRDLLRLPLVWTEELARYLYVWLTFLGAIFITYDNEHIRIDIISDYLPSAVRKILDLLINISMAIYCAAVFKGGMVLVKLNIGAFTASLPRFITYAHVYGIVPVAMGCMFLLLASKIWFTLTEFFGSKEINESV